jgi:hypothetical protein
MTVGFTLPWPTVEKPDGGLNTQAVQNNFDALARRDPGSNGRLNLDGGRPDSVYGGIPVEDGGGV